ncbi:blue copper protein 1a-like [Triticum dicoccoides]|uniref:blue copper protein 1a-like n=1 Tax=Triticum dicoccoides TaxID=85692 RepID=UPI001890556D|nr:blue copper protein 1a-like [Triticum dicoccoides]
MTSKQTLVVAITVAALTIAFLPGLAVAMEHVVGDDMGWALDFNYTAWAETKQFVVGDTLVFEYGTAGHDVVEVGGPDFLACNQPDNAVVWTSGLDRVALDKAGPRWFFCGMDQHCKRGMKLKITVLETAPPAPQPKPPLVAPPPSSPAGKLEARFGEAVAVVTAVAVALLVL